jgi:tetratricopeptide (TPR) repeat protein
LWLAVVSAPGTAIAQPVIEYTGCRTVRTAPTRDVACVARDSREMVLWVGTPPEARLRIRGAKLLARATVLEGEQLRVELEPDASQLVVEGAGTGTWSLAIVPLDWPPWLAEARNLIRERKLDEARDLAHAKAEAPANAMERAGALGVLSRVALGTGRWADAERSLRDAVVADEHAGLPLEEVLDGTALVWLLMDRGRLAEAASQLNRLPNPSGLPADVAYYYDFYGGMLARERGDLRRALELMANAVGRGERLNLTERAQAHEVLAGLLQRVRGVETQDAFADLTKKAEGAQGCERAELLDNAAWARLLDCEAGPCTPPVKESEEAVRLYDAVCTDWAAGRLNALVNLALGYYDAGRPADAHAALERARASDPDPALRIAVWSLEVEGRLALLEKRSDDALGHYERLAEAANQMTAPEAQWRAAVGRARVLTRLDDPKAVAAYAEAEKLLDAESRFVPMHEGRESFVARRERATREYLELLLKRGQQEPAFAVARHARARVLRGMRLDARLAAVAPEASEYAEERARIEPEAEKIWAMSEKTRSEFEVKRSQLRRKLLDVLDEVSLVVANDGNEAEILEAPAVGEVLLGYHPLPEGWVGFADNGHRVVAKRIGALEPMRGDASALAEAIYAPFAEQIGKAHSVRLLPYGLLRQIDLQTLPVGGGPLIAKMPVSFGLDLPSASALGDDAKVALLVGDPTGDLPWAAAEVEEVARALGPEWDVHELVGPAATSAEVRRLIPTATLFHYAGHAVFSGRGGWTSELPLAENTSLGIEDILAFTKAPRWVVLSGCDAAMLASEAPFESMGLAHAFLLAGSSTVIAPVREVNDERAAGLVVGLYEAWDGSGDLAAALQRAQANPNSGSSSADWASFRAIVR